MRGKIPMVGGFGGMSSYRGGFMQRVHFSSGGRYPVLRAIAIIYLVLGGLSVLGGIVAVFWMLLRAPFDSVDRVILAAAALGGSVFWCADAGSGRGIKTVYRYRAQHANRVSAGDAGWCGDDEPGPGRAERI